MLRLFTKGLESFEQWLSQNPTSHSPFGNSLGYLATNRAMLVVLLTSPTVLDGWFLHASVFVFLLPVSCFLFACVLSHLTCLVNHMCLYSFHGVICVYLLLSEFALFLTVCVLLDLSNDNKAQHAHISKTKKVPRNLEGTCIHFENFERTTNRSRSQQQKQ